jgi:hypothetical protein
LAFSVVIYCGAVNWRVLVPPVTLGVVDSGLSVEDGLYGIECLSVGVVLDSFVVVASGFDEPESWEQELDDGYESFAEDREGGFSEVVWHGSISASQRAAAPVFPHLSLESAANTLILTD